MPIIHIEGNIGSGKTTLIDNLEKLILFTKLSDKKFVFIREPIDKWKPYLELFYNDKKRWSMTLQYKIFLDYENIYKSIDLLTLNDIYYIIERSLYTAFNIFVNNLYEINLINKIEYKSLCEHYEMINNYYKKFGDTYTIYVRTSSNISHDRILNRGHKYENNISKDYLKALEYNMDRYYKKIDNNYVIKGNLDKMDIFEKAIEIISNI